MVAVLALLAKFSLNTSEPVSYYAGMKTPIFLLLALSFVLTACETANPPGGASSFQLSAEDRARHQEREARKAQEMAANAGGGSLMYQSNVSGPFGSSSSTGMVRSSGGVQSYQTIGGQPVYPGMPVPGYNYPGPSVNGGPGTYIDARTGLLMYRR
jgi:hypothetical protein